MKEIIVLGGPNGAGKTTAVPELLPKELGIVEFVNADEIARGLSPLNPQGSDIAAARLLLQRLHSLAIAGESFGFETMCAGLGHVRFLRDCRALGYRITIIFLWLPSPDIALKRVAQRVRQGGHGIATDVVIRRYWTGLRNLQRFYLPLASSAFIYDNSDDGRLLVFESTPAAELIHDPTRWKMIREAIE